MTAGVFFEIFQRAYEAVIIRILESLKDLVLQRLTAKGWNAGQHSLSPSNTGILENIMALTNPFQFIQQTRAEITKVVWPTRREVLITTAMVLVLAIIAALFFSGTDALIRLGLRSLLGLFWNGRMQPLENEAVGG